jgi:hypothetical protein
MTLLLLLNSARMINPVARYTRISNVGPFVPDLPPVTPAQQQTIALDFGDFLSPGTTLVGTPTLNFTVESGVDPTPTSRISGGPVIGTAPTTIGGTGIADGAILFQVAGCVEGVTYLAEVVCDCSDGNIAEGFTHLRCVLPS